MQLVGYVDRISMCTEVHVLPQVTPASYLELLTTFIKLLAEKRKDIGISRQRLEAGLSKLLTTAAQVEVMQVPKARLLAVINALQMLIYVAETVYSFCKQSQWAGLCMYAMQHVGRRG